MTPLENKIVKTIPLSVYMKRKFSFDTNSFQRTSCPCPLPTHKEKQGKSFVYDDNTSRWRCYGKCHKGGNIVDLHMATTLVTDRDECIRSLLSLFKIDPDTEGFNLDFKSSINFEDLDKRWNQRQVLSSLDKRAKGSSLGRTSLGQPTSSSSSDLISEYLLLDYVMSFSVPEEDRETIHSNSLAGYKEPGFFSGNPDTHNPQLSIGDPYV